MPHESIVATEKWLQQKSEIFEDFIIKKPSLGAI